MSEFNYGSYGYNMSPVLNACDMVLFVW